MAIASLSWAETPGGNWPAPGWFFSLLKYFPQVNDWTTVIRLVVNVPVLSEQIVVAV
jgi:hypothetical protein